MSDDLTRIPDQLLAGDTWKWKVSLSDYPASSGWTLYYYLVNQSISKITLTSSASDDDHQIEVAKADTAGYAAGIYNYQAVVASSTKRYLVESGRVEVLPNYAAQTGTYDDRSFARKMVDALETALLTSAASGDIIEYTIGGRSVKKDRYTVRRELDYWKAQVLAEKRRERAKMGLSTNRTVKVRFT